MEKHITLPLTEELAKTLHAGDTLCVESCGQSTNSNYGYIQIKVEIK